MPDDCVPGGGDYSWEFVAEVDYATCYECGKKVRANKWTNGYTNDYIVNGVTFLKKWFCNKKCKNAFLSSEMSED